MSQPQARKRFDPPSRSADGFRAHDRLKNADPKRKYVYADPNNQLQGVQFYLENGYVIEKVRPGGPLPAGGTSAAEGANVTWMGQLLMSKPLEEWEAQYQESQATATAWETRMRMRSGVDDPLRGLGQGVSYRNETSESYVEKGA